MMQHQETLTNGTTKVARGIQSEGAARSVSAEVAGAPRVSVVRRVDRWLRERSLLLLGIAVVAGFSWPAEAGRVLSHPRLFGVTDALSYDARTFALAVIVFSAALRCTPRDFAQVVRSKAGVANLISVYLVVPAIALGIAFATLKLGSESLRGVALGLVLSVMVPVAMTSAVWTRASQGSVPVALGTLGVTSVLAALFMPPVIERLASMPGVAMHPSLASVRMQVILAFALPLILGSSIRAVASRAADSLEPLFSIASVVALFAFVGDSAAALRPHLASHQGAVAVALVLTVVTNAAAYFVGYCVAKARGLDDADTVAVVFGSGMRSVPAALVVGAIAFPGVALVSLPPVLWSVTQQLLAGILTRRFLHARDLAEPVLPLKRRVAEVTARVASASRPALAELEDSIVMPLCRELEDTLVYRPSRDRAPSVPG